MAEQPLLDPFWFWRNLVEQMGKSVNQNAKENMQSEEFGRALAHVTDASVAGRNMTRALMKKYFEAFDLPSRSDMLALDERLQAIEDQLINLTATLNRLNPDAPVRAAQPTGTAPARTRKPPAAGGSPPSSAAPTAPPSSGGTEPDK